MKGFILLFHATVGASFRESARTSRVACEPLRRGCFSGPGIPYLLGGYHSGALVATPVHAAVGAALWSSASTKRKLVSLHAATVLALLQDAIHGEDHGAFRFTF